MVTVHFLKEVPQEGTFHYDCHSHVQFVVSSSSYLMR